MAKQSKAKQRKEERKERKPSQTESSKGATQPVISWWIGGYGRSDEAGLHRKAVNRSNDQRVAPESPTNHICPSRHLRS